MRRAVRYLAVIYLATLLVLWGLIHFDTGGLWQVTLFLFSPRWAVAVPLVILIPLTLAFDFRLVFAYVLHGLIILIPILGYRVSWTESADTDPASSLRVMTYNLGGGAIDIDKVVDLTVARKIDVLVLQECPNSLSKPIFEKLGWTRRQQFNLAIGSPYELGEMRIVTSQRPEEYNGVAAAFCDLHVVDARLGNASADAPPKSRAVRIVDVHFPTFRPAFEQARQLDLDTATAIAEVGAQYSETVEPVRREVEAFQAPTIIAGDFNVPVESAYYRNYWSDYQNALSRVGHGLRYTKHTRIHGVRIDHVLADGNWSIVSAEVGPGLGGDHRPVIVELALKE